VKPAALMDISGKACPLYRLNEKQEATSGKRTPISDDRGGPPGVDFLFRL
jgi:hypothetical protein